jgi:predicted deacylase
MAYFDIAPGPGEIVRRRVTVGQLADGSPAYVPVVVIRGVQDGPTAYLQAGIHGDEITGIEVCRRLVASIDPAEVRGRVVAVPIGNVPAYLDRKRSHVEEERGPIDMNRVFPGDPCGLLTERIAAALVGELLEHADYALDFHSALAGCNIMPCAYVSAAPTHPLRPAQEQLASSLGWGLTCLQEGITEFGHTNLSRSFCAVAERAGVPAIIAELGESGRITGELIDLGVRGARQVLVDQGNLPPGSPAPAAPGTSFRNIAFVHAERGGIVNHCLPLGSAVRAGDELAVVSDPVTGESTGCRAPFDGLVLRQLTLGTCAVGAELVWVAHDIVNEDGTR